MSCKPRLRPVRVRCSTEYPSVLFLYIFKFILRQGEPGIIEMSAWVTDQCARDSTKSGGGMRPRLTRLMKTGPTVRRERRRGGWGGGEVSHA